MKYLIYTLVLSVGLLPAWTPVALATATGTGTGTGTSTKTETETKKCSENRTQTQGFQDNNCYSYNTSANQDQKNAQQDTKKTNDKGGSQMTAVGMAAIAAGGAMVAMGMAMKPPNPGLIAAGVALMGMGAMSLMGAKKAKQNSDVANANDYKLADFKPDTYNNDNDNDKTTTKNKNKDNPSTVSHTPLVSTTLPDDATGRSKAIFEEFHQQTGINPSQLVSDINSGKSVAEALGNNDKIKMSPEELQAAMDKSLAEGGAGAGMTNSDMMSKLGMSQEDLDALAAANAKGTTGMGDDSNAYATNGSGSGASRAPASASGANTSLDGLFGKKDDAVVPGGSAVGGSGDLSPEVQAALDRAGISGLSIFQMVHSQYRRKTPMMFGVERAKNPAPTDAANPFSNLGADNKVEF